MKILYISLLNVSNSSGAKEHVFGVCNGLAKLGHDIHLIVGHSEPDPDVSITYHKLNLHLVSYQELNMLQRGVVFSSKALQLIQDVQPEIIYLRAFPMDYFFLSRKLRRLGIPFVYELNAITDAEYRSKEQVLKGKIFTWFEGRTLALASMWAVVTNEIHLYAKRISRVSKPYFIARNGVNISEADPHKSRALIRQELGVGESKTVLIMAGFSSPWHGMDRAVKMLSMLESDAELWLVGSPNRQTTDYVNGLAEGEGVLDSVRVFPWMNKQDVANMIGAADVGIGALAIDIKDMKEAQALKIRLYLAIGIPVLINHVDLGVDSSLPYVCYVPSNNPKELAKGMDQLIEEKGRYKEEARNYAIKHLSWDAIAEETANYMADLLREGQQ